eukprot:sb/3473546/
MVDDTGGGGPVKSHALGLRIQKKVLGKMASRSIARHFIDDEAGKILDTLYIFLKDTLPDAEAKKVTKSIIKIIIKLGILYHNDQLSINEKQILKQMVKRFSRLIMTIVTFWEVGIISTLRHHIVESISRSYPLNCSSFCHICLEPRHDL